MKPTNRQPTRDNSRAKSPPAGKTLTTATTRGTGKPTRNDRRDDTRKNPANDRPARQGPGRSQQAPGQKPAPSDRQRAATVGQKIDADTDDTLGRHIPYKGPTPSKTSAANVSPASRQPLGSQYAAPSSPTWRRAINS